MKTKILSFFLVLAPAVPALFLLSACRPEPWVEPVVGFSINVPDWFDLGNGMAAELNSPMGYGAVVLMSLRRQ